MFAPSERDVLSYTVKRRAFGDAGFLPADTEIGNLLYDNMCAIGSQV